MKKQKSKTTLLTLKPLEEFFELENLQIKECKYPEQFVIFYLGKGTTFSPQEQIKSFVRNLLKKLLNKELYNFYSSIDLDKYYGDNILESSKEWEKLITFKKKNKDKYYNKIA